jgi:hypothetical protein
LKLVDGFHDLLEKGGGALVAVGRGIELEGTLDLGTGDFEIEEVEAVPLLGGDLFADMASVFARSDDAGDYGGFVGSVKGEGACEVVGIAVPLELLGLAEGGDEAQPAVVGAGGALVEHEIQVDVEEAGGVLCALEVTAHPVQ